MKKQKLWFVVLYLLFASVVHAQEFSVRFGIVAQEIVPIVIDRDKYSFSRTAIGGQAMFEFALDEHFRLGVRGSLVGEFTEIDARLDTYIRILPPDYFYTMYLGLGMAYVIGFQGLGYSHITMFTGVEILS